MLCVFGLISRRLVAVHVSIWNDCDRGQSVLNNLACKAGGRQRQQVCTAIHRYLTPELWELMADNRFSWDQVRAGIVNRMADIGPVSPSETTLLAIWCPGLSIIAGLHHTCACVSRSCVHVHAVSRWGAQR